MSRRRCVLLGGGGHARVLIDALFAGGDVDIVGIVERNDALWAHDIYGVAIVGDDSRLPELIAAGADHFVVALGGTRENRPRQALFDVGLRAGLRPLTVVHPAAIRSPRADVGDGCQLLAGSIVNAGATLAANVLVNTGAIVEHDCVIGEHVHVASGAVLLGSVRAGARAHIGAGATVRQGVEIGADAVIGAGAVVVKDVPAGMTFIGVPARPLQV